MNDRLQELIRQRTLVQEHLAWLDREIVAATGKAVPATLTPKAPGAQTVAPFGISRKSDVPPTGEAASPDELDPLLAQYREEPENLTANVKRGCLIYFCAAMAILGVTVFLVYLLYVQRSAKPAAPSPMPAAAPAKKL